ncbi:MAG: DUF1592 domain-containing protein, partial [Planctomycetota bacterium]
DGADSRSHEESPTKLSEKASKAQSDWLREGWPLMQQFCVDCHGADEPEAELDLSRFGSLAAIQQDGAAFQRALDMIRFGAMPPEDYDLPTDAQRQVLGDSIDQTLFVATCDLRPKPSKITTRRLNRAEYNNTVRDLLGVDLDPAAAFPSDEVGGGFDNNADVLSLSTLLIEKYLDAANSIAKAAVIDPSELPRIDADRPADQLVVQGDFVTGSFNGRFPQRDAYVWTQFDVPLDGRYSLSISGGASMEDKQSRLAIYGTDGVLIAICEFGYYGGSGRSDRERETVELTKGPLTLIMEPVLDDRELVVGQTRFSRLSELTDQVIADGLASLGKLEDVTRYFDHEVYPTMLRRVSLEGPSEYPDSMLGPKQNEIARSVPIQRSDGSFRKVDQSAERCLEPLLQKMFRGPVTDEELEPYVDLTVTVTEQSENYYTGLRTAIAAALVSPRFLFRSEMPPSGWQPDAPDSESALVKVTPYQLATRLSYFLWSSTPDEALLEAARRNQLRGDGLRKQVRRMLTSDKARTLASEFAAQWLGLRNLQGHQVDSDQFQQVTPELIAAMQRETETLFLSVLQRNLPAEELLLADYTFVNEALATYYGLDKPYRVATKKSGTTDSFVRVSLKSTPRRGVLGHAGVLTLTSYPTRTSPVLRGKWILENVLGTPPPEPPANVPELGETKTADASASLREQLELHRDDPGCAACHRVMDQLGFGLEEFDAVGRYRSDADGIPIDASGELPGGRVFSGGAELSQILGKSERKAFARTVSKRLLGFALGRELTPNDRCTIDTILQTTEKSGHRMTDLIMEIIESQPFQYYEWEVADNE